MEKYKVLSVEPSIVQPEMVDVELANSDNHLSDCVRVSRAIENVAPYAECIVHDDKHGLPVAYSFGDDMHLASAPETRNDALYQISTIRGLTRCSLDRLHFYMALRGALKKRGIRPSLSPVSNMLHLALIQENIKGR